MKIPIDITDICNYDGKCMLSQKNREEGYGFCHGQLFGTNECPLSNKAAIIGIKQAFSDDVEIYDVLEKKEK